MDLVITAAARALTSGDPLAALKRVALRDDAPALALRGIAMAQLSDFACARLLLRRAARGFGPKAALERARCTIADVEIALVSRDLSRTGLALDTARKTLEMHGDLSNAAHAGYLQARRLLLIGQLDEAERTLAGLDADLLPLASRAGHALVDAGLALRRIQTRPASAAIDRARHAAHAAGIPALVAEVETVAQALHTCAARLIDPAGERSLRLEEVEALLDSGALVVDACRQVVRAADIIVPLTSRPVLFSLMRTLAEAWPDDVSREALLGRAFRARHVDESYRVRLRVEIGRLRKVLEPIAGIVATAQGFALALHGPDVVAVLVPPIEAKHADVLALLADGEAWRSSALALALGVSPRTAQRALQALAETDRVEFFGRGRACRWIATNVPGFPTSLLLPASVPVG